MDGRTFARIGPGDPVRLRRSRFRLPLLEPADHDFFEMLRSKLAWAASLGRTGS